MLKLRKDNLMDIICSVASPNTAVLFIYIYTYSHLLFVVSFRYANGFAKNTFI